MHNAALLAASLLLAFVVVGCSSSSSPSMVAAKAPNKHEAKTPAIYVVGGQVTGLRGIGLTLRDGRGEEVQIRNDGSFVIGAPMPNGASYSVSIEKEPISPMQTCAIAIDDQVGKTNRILTSGKINGHDAIEVNIVCNTVSLDNVLTPVAMR